MIEVKLGEVAQLGLKALNTVTVSTPTGTSSIYFEDALITSTHTGTKTYGPFKQGKG